MTDSESAPIVPGSIAGVRLIGDRRHVTFAACDLTVSSGTRVVLMTADGERTGTVVIANADLLEYHGSAPTARVLRLATRDEPVGDHEAAFTTEAAGAVLDALELPDEVLRAHDLSSAEQEQSPSQT